MFFDCWTNYFLWQTFEKTIGFLNQWMILLNDRSLIKRKWKINDIFEKEQSIFLNDWKKLTKWVVHEWWMMNERDENTNRAHLYPSPSCLFPTLISLRIALSNKPVSRLAEPGSSKEREGKRFSWFLNKEN